MDKWAVSTSEAGNVDEPITFVTSGISARRAARTDVFFCLFCCFCCFFVLYCICCFVIYDFKHRIPKNETIIE